MFEKSRLFAESWNVAYRKGRPGSILTNTDDVFYVIPNSRRYWAADPFLFEFQNKTYVFAELYDYMFCRGVLGYCIIGEDQKPKWKPVIVENYHLSFPYIYQDGNEIYIMAESSASALLYRYRAVEFPDHWERVETIRKKVKLADTVLLHENGHSYALTYNVENANTPYLCWLDLDEPEKDKMLSFEHQELRRPAGRVLQSEKIRSAQNCAGDYGKGLVFYRYSVKQGEYEETEIKRVFPQDVKLSKKLYLDGMHTYNFSENYEVIDIKTRRFNLLNLCFRFIAKLR